VVVRVEEAIQDLVGIKKIRSTAAENMGTILVEAEDGADLRKLVGDITSRVDAIDTFPLEAEEPIIEEAVVRKQVLEVAISGQADERTLKRRRASPRSKSPRLGPTRSRSRSPKRRSGSGI